MGTQFNSEFGETGKQGVENGNRSEPEIYLLISHNTRPRGGRRIGLFGPFGPRGPKSFGFPHGGPRGIGHPQERPHDRAERSNVHHGPPRARKFRYGPRFMHDPEKEFTDERSYGPQRGMRRFDPGPHEKRLEPDSEFHREPRYHTGLSRRPHSLGPREHGHEPRGGSYSGLEIKECVRSPYHHPSREHRLKPRGGNHNRFETEERIRSPYREHSHCPRDKFESEGNVKQLHRGNPGNHECSPCRDPQSHKHGQGPDRFEAEENVKEIHGKRGRRNGHSSPREHGHGLRGRFEKELGYHSDHTEHHRHEFGLRGGRIFEYCGHGSELDYESDHLSKSFGHHHGSRKFEHSRHESESESESDYSSKSFGHYRGHRFEHGRHGIDSHHLRKFFRNNRSGFDSRGKRRLIRDGPRLHRHARRHRYGILRSHPSSHHHLNKSLTPEELAEKVARLNSMGFTPENNSHYEELLKRFNGNIGRVVDTLLKEREKEKNDDERNDENDEVKEKEEENRKDYNIVEEEVNK